MDTAEFWFTLRREGVLIWSTVETHPWDSVEERVEELRATYPGLEVGCGEYDRNEVSTAHMDY